MVFLCFLVISWPKIVVWIIPASGGGRAQHAALEINGITGELVNFRFAFTSALDKQYADIEGVGPESRKCFGPSGEEEAPARREKIDEELRDIDANTNPEP